MAVLLPRSLAVVAMAVLLAACGGGGSTAGMTDDDPVLRPEDRAEPSKACRDQFVASHNMEQAGTPTAIAFLPSVQACSSLAEWSAVSRSENTPLDGREYRFVHGVCLAADPATRDSTICQEAAAQAKVR